MRLLASTILFIALTACSSKALRVNYYLLYSAEPVSVNVTEKTQDIVLNEIILADYLKQSSLAMKIANNKLYFSRQDVWAESLQTAISSALLNDLNVNSAIQFNSYRAPTPKKNGNQITLQIDHLYSTQQSSVEMSGRYWLHLNGNVGSVEFPFYLQLPLKQDGYSHAVSQQRDLITLLANKILQDLTLKTKIAN